MLEEISKNRMEEFGRYFPGPQLEMVFASIVEGNTEAQLWYAFQPNGQVVCLLWDQGNNVFYLSGPVASPETRQDLAALFRTVIKEKALKDGLSYFKVKPLSAELEDALADMFQNIQLYKTNKLFYTFPANGRAFLPESGVADIQYYPIDGDLLAEGRFDNSSPVTSELQWMWPSLERFLKKGFGTAAVINGRIICWCTAEYVSRHQCGIGIEVVDEYRNKGVATATAARFLEQCLRRNIVAHWECGKENSGSVRVAEKLGFEKIEETVFWIGQFSR